MLEKLMIVAFILFAGPSMGQACPVIDMPTNGAVDVPVDVMISWPHVNGYNGYLISIGTTPGGTELLENEAIGIDNFYRPPLGLPENTQIFVTISLVPFDAPPIACPGISFTTTDVTSPPPCTFITAPDNNAANVTVVTDIVWSYAPTATSYNLSIGITEGGTEILNNHNVGNVLTYDPPADLPQDSFIYVTILPENENGTLPSCTEERFFTGTLEDVCNPVDQITGETHSLVPEIDFPSQIGLCLNGGPLVLNTVVEADGFRWFRNLGSSQTLLSETRNLSVTEPGNYILEAFVRISHEGEIFECANMKNFTVVSSEMASITAVEVENLPLGKQVTVNVEGTGWYEYALDDENGHFQNSPVFERVSDGPHVVYVRDKNGCGTVSKLIERGLKTEDFPKFFTPNGDGVNDFWQFIAPGEVAKPGDLLRDKISIFDRYGSLLLQLDPQSKGWDGRFRGIELPSSDYWFRAVSTDQQEITGHFTLKR